MALPIRVHRITLHETFSNILSDRVSLVTSLMNPSNPEVKYS